MLCFEVQNKKSDVGMWYMPDSGERLFDGHISKVVSWLSLAMLGIQECGLGAEIRRILSDSCR